jgi:hypothetical protein
MTCDCPAGPYTLHDNAWYNYAKAAHRGSCMSNFTIFFINLGIPALMFLIGAAFLLLEFQRWLRKKEGNALHEATRDKRRRHPAIMLALGILLITPASCLITFFISRGFSSANNSDTRNLNTQLSIDSVNGGIRFDGQGGFNYVTWHALERSTLESLDRAKPFSSGFFKGPSENAPRNYLAADIAEAAHSQFTFGLRYEMTLLKEAPSAYFGRFAPAPALTSVRFTLPITHDQMSPLAKFAFALSIRLQLPDNPDQHLPRQVDNIRHWTRGLDFPPLTFILTPAALTPDTQNALLALPRIQGVWLRNIKHTDQLLPWQACKEIEHLQLDMAPDAKGPLCDFTTFPRLTNLSITNLNPQTSDHILDTCTNVKILRIDHAPGFKSTTIQRLSTLPKLRWICLKNLNLDAIPVQDWEKLRTAALYIHGCALSQDAIALIARTNTHDGLVLSDTPLSIGVADALSCASALRHLSIGEPQPGALIKLAALTQLRGLDVHTSDPTRVSAELADLRKKLPNLNIRINPTQEMWSMPW